MATKCLDEIANEMAKGDTCVSGVSTSATQSLEKSESDSQNTKEESKEAEKSPTKDNSCEESSDKCAAAQGSPSKETDTAEQQQGASASHGDSVSGRGALAKDSATNWITRSVNAGHAIMWPPGMTPSTGPTLLTGVKLGDSDVLVDDLMEWKRKFESASLENHSEFLQNAQLPVASTVANHPMEAAAWENGYVPESRHKAYLLIS